MQTQYSRQQNIERQKPQTAKILRTDEEVDKGGDKDDNKRGQVEEEDEDNDKEEGEQQID